MAESNPTRLDLGPTRGENQIDGVIVSPSLENLIHNVQVIELHSYDHNLIFFELNL